jgi:hypothetical protein
VAKCPELDGLSLLREEVPQEVLKSAKALFSTRQRQLGLAKRSDRGVVSSLRRGSDSPVQDGQLQLTA